MRIRVTFVAAQMGKIANLGVRLPTGVCGNVGNLGNLHPV